MPYAKQIDGNQGPIVRALRQAGAKVRSLAALGDGMPDLLVGFGGLTVLMEVKLPMPQFTSKQGGKRGEKRPLTPAEVAALDPQADFTDAEKTFHAQWKGQPIITVRCVSDALKAIGVE